MAVRNPVRSSVSSGTGLLAVKTAVGTDFVRELELVGYKRGFFGSIPDDSWTIVPGPDDQSVEVDVVYFDFDEGRSPEIMLKRNGVDLFGPEFYVGVPTVFIDQVSGEEASYTIQYVTANGTTEFSGPKLATAT